jgi:hypothetical protein
MTDKKSLRPFIICVKNTLRVQERGTAALHDIYFHLAMMAKNRRAEPLLQGLKRKALMMRRLLPILLSVERSFRE